MFQNPLCYVKLFRKFGFGVNLSALKVGQEAKLLSYGDAAVSYQHRLTALGLTPQSAVTLVKKAPLGCPVVLSVRNTLLSIRLDEAKDLVWELL